VHGSVRVDEPNCGGHLVADAVDHAVVLQSHEALAELLLRDILVVFVDKSLLRLAINEIEQIRVLDSVLIYFRFEVRLHTSVTLQLDLPELVSRNRKAS